MRITKIITKTPVLGHKRPQTIERVPGIKGIGPGYALQLPTVCPHLVDWVLEELDDRAQECVAAQNPTLVKYVVRCSANRNDLRVSRELVTLQSVEVEAYGEEVAP